MKLLLPPGFIIPFFADITSLRGGDVVKVQIRRSDWVPESLFAKCLIIEGSCSTFFIDGEPFADVAIVVEAEFDAILLARKIKNSFVIATGGATKRRNAHLTSLLLKKRLILFSMDFDDAGTKAFEWWRANFWNLRPWRSPCEKSIADAYLKEKVDLNDWFKAGIEKYFHG